MCFYSLFFIKIFTEKNIYYTDRKKVGILYNTHCEEYYFLFQFSFLKDKEKTKNQERGFKKMKYFVRNSSNKFFFLFLPLAMSSPDGWLSILPPFSISYFLLQNFFGCQRVSAAPKAPFFGQHTFFSPENVKLNIFPL